MAVHKLYNASITVGGVSLKAWCKAVRINQEADAHDISAMGDTTKKHLGGLLGWTIEADFEQDYAAAAVDATLSPLVGTTASIVVKPDDSAVSATNPSWTGTGLLVSYSPLGGNHGDAHMTQARFVSAGALTRATS
jgi:hypothetical protein